MDDTELTGLTALEQARLVRRGLVSSTELVMAHLRRIERLNPRLSAVVDVLADRALREARVADHTRGERPPFLGVPTAVKDLNPARGSFTRFGSRAFERLFTPFDDATVGQLRKGGFVILGKTATSELGTLPVTEPDIHPPTRNPWDVSVTPGGSSGGAGAAVAAGMVPVAQGSDAGGSIRIPSSLCGLYGIKPSRGRVPNSYWKDDAHLIYTCGPLARTVDDAAAMLDVMAGITVGTPHWAPPPPRPFLELAREPPRALRIRFATSLPGVTTDPDVKEAVLRVARALEKLGHHVEEAPFVEGSVDEFLPIWQRSTLDAPVYDWALTSPVTRWLADKGRAIDAKAVAALTTKMANEVAAWWNDADMWLSPTVAIRPPKIGAWKGLSPEELFAKATEMGVFTAPFNVSGQPAASVPAGLSRHGHPIGVQLAGRPLDDATVLAVSRQLEEVLGWSHPHAVAEVGAGEARARGTANPNDGPVAQPSSRARPSV